MIETIKKHNEDLKLAMAAKHKAEKEKQAAIEEAEME